MKDEKNDGQNKKRRTKKTKEERETKWGQEYLQIWEIVQLTNISRSKVKKAIKDGVLKSDQTCNRGMHLCHINDVRQWVAGRKGR